MIIKKRKLVKSSTNYVVCTETAQVSSETTFTGPASQDYTITDSVPFTSTIWSPCGAALPLNINTQIRLSTTATATTGGLLTTDTVDGHVTFILGIQWQVCKP